MCTENRARSISCMMRMCLFYEVSCILSFRRRDPSISSKMVSQQVKVLFFFISFRRILRLCQQKQSQGGFLLGSGGISDHIYFGLWIYFYACRAILAYFFCFVLDFCLCKKDQLYFSSVLCQFGNSVHEFFLKTLYLIFQRVLFFLFCYFFCSILLFFKFVYFFVCITFHFLFGLL